MHFIERLKQVGGLKGTDIANMAGVSESTVSRWASGRKSPHSRSALARRPEIPRPTTLRRYDFAIRERGPRSPRLLASTGLDSAAFGRLSYMERQSEYPRSQEIAEACAFLGADELLVPSARHQASNNLVVFCEQDTRIAKEAVRNHGIVDF